VTSATELARLLAIAAGLPPADSALLRRLIEAVEPHQSRVVRRDKAIRAALARTLPRNNRKLYLAEHFPGNPCQAAKALASAWAAYASGQWRAEQSLTVLPDAASPRHAGIARHHAAQWRQSARVEEYR
jgi:hypothetical protein